MNKVKVKEAITEIFRSRIFYTNGLDIDLNKGYTPTIKIRGLKEVIIDLISVLEENKSYLDLDIITKDSITGMFADLTLVINAHSYDELKSKLGYLRIIVHE